jgi:hypothetical protein
MKGCLTALGIVVGLIVGVVSFIVVELSPSHVRYRLTVEVQDGDQIRTGSSVIDASYPKEAASLGAPITYLVGLSGCAPTVDLGKKGMLFLTFENIATTPANIHARNSVFLCPKTDIWCLPFAAYSKPDASEANGVRPDFSNRNTAVRELLRQRGPRDVPFAVLPQLGRFLDTNNPLSLVRVSPYALAQSFGTGVELKRVTIEMTDDPVTPVPEIWPQWLKEKGQMSGKLTGWPDT